MEDIKRSPAMARAYETNDSSWFRFAAVPSYSGSYGTKTSLATDEI